MAALLGLLALLSTPAGISLRSVRVLTPHPAALSVVELEVNVSGEVQHPFDRRAFALDALVRDPVGKTVCVPGFLYQPYRRTYRTASRPIAYASTDTLAKGGKNTETKPNTEVMERVADPSWRVRITTPLKGSYRVTVRMKADGITTELPSQGLVVGDKEPGSTGFVRRSSHNPFAFARTTGESCFPIGANTCWGNERGTADFDRWLPRYGTAGANWGRVWLGPAWTTFALETAGSDGGKTKFGEFNLANAWRLDYVLELAAKHGIDLQFAIDSYNVIRDREAWPEWERSPYNRVSGGPLEKPTDFWTNEAAMAHYENKLAYIVARWGAYSNVFAWEFWNEVDGVAHYHVGPIRAWHARMASKLRALDPYHHMISTSFGGGGPQAGDASIFDLPSLDFSTSHIYNSSDIAATVAGERLRLGKLGKPWFVGETGMDAAGPREKDDPRGYQLHDSLWASLANGASAGAMLWWWDSYVDPCNLYPQFTVVNQFLKGLNWERSALRPIPCEGGYAAVGKGLAVVWIPKVLPSVKVQGMTPGQYRLEIWDTWTSAIVSSSQVRTTGSLNVPLPSYKRDIAVKLVAIGR